MIAIVRDELFPFFREEVSERTALGKYLEGARMSRAEGQPDGHGSQPH